MISPLGYYINQIMLMAAALTVCDCDQLNTPRLILSTVSEKWGKALLKPVFGLSVLGYNMADSVAEDAR